MELDYLGEQYFINFNFSYMDKNQIFEKLISILKIIGATATIKQETALLAELILDSLDFMNYITKVEEQFFIKISDSDIQNFQLGIMKNMVSYLSERMN